MIKNLTALILICCIVSSCQKEVNGDPDSDNPPKETITYQPVSKDSYWKYKMTRINYVGEDIFSFTSSGQQQPFDGITYNLFTNSPSSPGYENTLIGIKDHNYYNKDKGQSPSGSSHDITILYLNDTASVGYKWDVGGGYGGGFTLRILGEIKEKNITITVDGKTYSNVIHTSIDYQTTPPGGTGSVVEKFDYYVAKNIGIVRILTHVIEPPTKEFVTDLIEYSVK